MNAARVATCVRHEKVVQVAGDIGLEERYHLTRSPCVKEPRERRFYARPEPGRADLIALHRLQAPMLRQVAKEGAGFRPSPDWC